MTAPQHLRKRPAAPRLTSSVPIAALVAAHSDDGTDDAQVCPSFKAPVYGCAAPAPACRRCRITWRSRRRATQTPSCARCRPALRRTAGPRRHTPPRPPPPAAAAGVPPAPGGTPALRRSAVRLSRVTAPLHPTGASLAARTVWRVRPVREALAARLRTAARARRRRHQRLRQPRVKRFALGPHRRCVAAPFDDANQAAQVVVTQPAADNKHALVPQRRQRGAQHQVRRGAHAA